MFTIVLKKTGRAFVRVLPFALIAFTAIFGGTVMADSTPPGKLFNVNAHKVHINCTGHGSPVVILVSGLGGTSLEWVPVQRHLSRHTRVCSYDRPGYGWSEMSTAPRNARTMARELHELLLVSGEPGPYILVGHSLGGHIVRLYANEFADSVSGLVLVDAAHEGMFALLGKYQHSVNTSKSDNSPDQGNKGPQVPDNFPEELKPLALQQMLQFQTRFAIAGEMRQFRQSADEVQQSSKLPSVPVTVVSRDPRVLAHEGRNGLVARQWADMQVELHQRLGNLKHVIADDSGHYPHLDRPELVASTIMEHLNYSSSRQWLSKL